MKAANLRVRIVVEEEGDSFHAYCPDFKDVHVTCDTTKEAIECAIDAAVIYVRSLKQHGKPLPVDVLRKGNQISLYEQFAAAASERIPGARARVSFIKEIELPDAA